MARAKNPKSLRGLVLGGAVATLGFLNSCVPLAIGAAYHELNSRASDQRLIAAQKDLREKDAQDYRRASLQGDDGEFRISSIWRDLNNNGKIDSMDEMGPEENSFGPDQPIMMFYKRGNKLPEMDIIVNNPKINIWLNTSRYSDNVSLRLNFNRGQVPPGTYFCKVKFENTVMLTRTITVRPY